jgi:hypothetical protein
MISQFSAILGNFRRKIGVFLKNQCYDHIFVKTSCSLSKNAVFFAEFFGENILKIITSVSGHPDLCTRTDALGRGSG